MPTIRQTEEQARILAGAGGPVTVRDPAGNALGSLDPKYATLIAEIMARRANRVRGPGYTTEQVQSCLAALDAERQRTGGFDGTRLRELLAELKAQDPPRVRMAP